MNSDDQTSSEADFSLDLVVERRAVRGIDNLAQRVGSNFECLSRDTHK